MMLAAAFVVVAIIPSDPQRGVSSISWNAPLSMFRYLALIAATLLFRSGVRALRSGVTVGPNGIVVRGFVRNVQINRQDVIGLRAPDFESVEQFARLRLRDGSHVTLVGLSRIRNRMFGDEKRRRRELERLALDLDVPLEEHQELAKSFKWG